MKRMVLVGAVLLAIPFEVIAQQVPDDFVIRLERSVCFGSCPDYSVSVDARGSIVYDGREFVRVSGRQEAVVPAERVRQLVDAVDRAGFFDLQSAYRWIDNGDGTLSTQGCGSPIFVTVTMQGRTKRIEDFFGAPDALHEIEALIDEVAGTQRWVRIDVDTLESMFQRNQAPPLDAQLDMVRYAFIYDEVDVLRVFLANGLDANSEWQGVPLIHMADSAAAVHALVTAGANANVKLGGASALQRAASHSPELAQALLDAGVPPEEIPPTGSPTPLWNAACRGNAGVVEVLLASGANPAVHFNNRSAVQCAQESARYHRPFPRGTAFKPPFEADYDGVIRLLDAALARRRGQ